jgi:hypothetical protein
VIRTALTGEVYISASARTVTREFCRNGDTARGAMGRASNHRAKLKQRGFVIIANAGIAAAS